MHSYERAIVGGMNKALVPAIGALSLLLVSGCSGPAAAVIPPQSERPVTTQAATTPTPTQTPTATEQPTPLPTTTATSSDPTPLPTDCRAILTPEVLNQLAGVPLNDPYYGSGTGVQPDGSLSCIWGNPADENTMLFTQITKHEPDKASALATEARATGMECTEVGTALRCSGEQRIEGMTAPVGRTLFVRGGVIIDTQFVNLAPDGYTNAIVMAIWPDLAPEPAPEPEPAPGDE